ncbi:MAG: TIGR02996 domain-containing protein [Labilithrix sp.]
MGGASNTMGGPGVNPDDPERPFRDAILADPADDTPRLVYADVLSERGDPRGELIVVQIQRERLEREGRRASAEYRRLRRREAELTGKRIGFQTYAERKTRGFTSQLWIGPSALRGRWGQFRNEPLEWITFQHDYGPVPELADLAWLKRQPEAARLRMIGLQTQTGSVSLDAATLAPPDESTLAWPDGLPPDPSLEPAVRRLHFHDWRPAFGPFIGRVASDLVELSVSGAPAADLLARIESLQKLSAWLEPEVAFTLLDAMQLPALRDLALQGHAKKSLGAEGGARLARSRVLPALTSLVADVPLDDVLAEALGPTKLEVLSPGLGVTEAGLRVFGESELPARLRWLGLTNRGAVTYARAVAEAPFERLESLKLEGFVIDEASAELFASHRGLAGLVDFKLTLCTMKPAAAQLLVRSPFLQHLIEPKFTQCRLTRETEDILRERWPDAGFFAA